MAALPNRWRGWGGEGAGQHSLVGGGRAREQSHLGSYSSSDAPELCDFKHVPSPL